MHTVVYFLHFLVAIAGMAAIVRLARKQALPAGVMPGRDLPVWFFLLGVLAIAVFEAVSFKASSPPDPLWDFLNAYYPAGKAALHHDLAMLRGLIGKGTSGFVNIPVVAYLFAPFALFPPKIAAALYTLIGMPVTVIAWFLLVRAFKLELRERWLLAFLFLVNGPLLNGIKFGNLIYFILCALAGGLVLVREGRSGAAGALLGVATVIKPPLALFGLFFLFGCDVRGVFGYTAVGVVTVLLSLLVFGLADNLKWFQICIVQYSHSWLSTFSVQSISAFVIWFRPGIGIDYTDLIAQIPTHGERLFYRLNTDRAACDHRRSGLYQGLVRMFRTRNSRLGYGPIFSIFSCFVLSSSQAPCPGIAITPGCSARRLLPGIEADFNVMADGPLGRRLAIALVTPLVMGPMRLAHLARRHRQIIRGVASDIWRASVVRAYGLVARKLGWAAGFTK